MEKKKVNAIQEDSLEVKLVISRQASAIVVPYVSKE